MIQHQGMADGLWFNQIQEIKSMLRQHLYDTDITAHNESVADVSLAPIENIYISKTNDMTE